ncbi:hypothetical protein C8R45DRAFT_1023058 [Mycena sanguinolenta]|nr:hypothetical protein C8R45DRAFT_1023058 [Mycena sanguinolenta]
MVKNYIDTDAGLDQSACRQTALLFFGRTYAGVQYKLGRDISYLVRLSPPCPVLYRELWLIPPSVIWSSESYPNGDKLIHHVSKWLEVRYMNVFGDDSVMCCFQSFPDSKMELITFWQQAIPDHDYYRIGDFRPDPDVEERDWCIRVEFYNDMIARLHLPDSLKVIL